MRRNVIAIGASAGGVEALRLLVIGLPEDLPATVLVVVHIPGNVRSALPEILQRSTTLTVRHARHGEVLAPGTVLVAPPDHHLLVEDDRVRLGRGPRENGHRPAIDVLFRSVARARGPGAVGVVLSGALDDGTIGMLAIQVRGGATVVQDPRDAGHASMPQSVIDHVEVDHVVPIAEMGRLLARLVSEAPGAATRAGEVGMNSDEMSRRLAPPLPEDESTEEAPGQDARNDREGVSSGYTCPDCHGVLWEVVDGKMSRFRCRTGHAFAPQSLLAMQGEGVEEAMWAAYRTLEEHAAMTKRLGARMREQGFAQSADRYDDAMEATLARAKLVRRALELAAGPPIDGTATEIADNVARPK